MFRAALWPGTKEANSQEELSTSLIFCEEWVLPTTMWVSLEADLPRHHTTIPGRFQIDFAPADKHKFSLLGGLEPEAPPETVRGQMFDIYAFGLFVMQQIELTQRSFIRLGNFSLIPVCWEVFFK